MQPVKILVLRFSAMGDVALMVPVIRSLTAAHADVEVTVVTRPRFARALPAYGNRPDAEAMARNISRCGASPYSLLW